MFQVIFDPGPHPRETALFRYSEGRLREPALGEIEEHLLVCEHCRCLVQEMDAFAALVRSRLRGHLTTAAFVHVTSDGPVWLRVDRLSRLRWQAVLCGNDLEGRAELPEARAAYVYLRRAFREMFPEHECVDDCGVGCPPGRERPGGQDYR